MQLKDDIERERLLRRSEREGRINIQKERRQKKSMEKQAVGFQMKPIGIVESPFPDRRGTPRQPLLVSAARGRIKMHVHHDFFAELAQFSHIWVIFIFHENTNEEGDVSAKITPPRLNKRVGCLSTRSPHRPNSIGLSVCKVAGVTPTSIEISCIDMIDGTPVLDVKPYIPYDILLSQTRLPMLAFAASLGRDIENDLTLHVPSWIHESDITLRPVAFTDVVLERLADIVGQGGLKYLTSLVETKTLITQVLAQDIRGHHQGRGQLTEHAASYECRLDNLRIMFITEDTRILVNHIEIYKAGSIAI